MGTLTTTWITNVGSTLVVYPTIDDISLFHSILDCLSCTYRNLNMVSKRMYVSYFKYNLVSFDDTIRTNIEGSDSVSILSKLSTTFDINIFICKRHVYDTIISNKYISGPDSPTILLLHNSSIDIYHPVGVRETTQDKMVLFREYDVGVLKDLDTYDINTEYKNPYTCNTDVSHDYYLKYNTSKFLK